MKTDQFIFPQDFGTVKKMDKFENVVPKDIWEEK